MKTILFVAALGLVSAPPARGQSAETIERLATLGRVWGFLKYYHPGVAAGTRNWDSTLIVTIPKIQAARSSAAFDSAMQALLDVAGPVPRCKACAAPGPDSTRLNMETTLPANLSVEALRRLADIRDNRHRGDGRYVSYQNTALFTADTAFSALQNLTGGQRLLALFRFWNAARYFFPYLSVNGGDWNAVLPEFIPRLLAAPDLLQYQLAVIELTTRLNDAHVTTVGSLAWQGSRSPAFEARGIEGQIVVWKLPSGVPAAAGGLFVGDVIMQVDGEPVAQRRRDLAKFIAAGNPAVFERKLVTAVMRGNADSATYVVERNGKALTLRVAMAPQQASAARPSYPVAELAKVLAGNIGYINMGDLDPDQVDDAYAIVEHTAGLVMDVRNYPRGTMYKFAALLNREPRPFATFAAVDGTYPGQVVWRPPYLAGPQGPNPGYYRGRMAILVDERTQSHAEFSVMALRTAPQSKVIGSQTAGADGNVTALTLPGGVRTMFTGLGVYYPDGRPTQRVGIVPDIVIRPTLSGIRAARDEVLERALEYLRSGH